MRRARNSLFKQSPSFQKPGGRRTVGLPAYSIGRFIGLSLIHIYSGEKDWEEGDFYRMDVTFSSSDWEGPTAPSCVSFWVDQWSYRDYEHDLTLPLAVVDGKETGQALCAQLWEISQPAES